MTAAKEAKEQSMESQWPFCELTVVESFFDDVPVAVAECSCGWESNRCSGATEATAQWTAHRDSVIEADDV